MLALAFNFPAGRYHATPWDRHVNEGAVAWPPEPWRVLRALMATWHHKVRHSNPDKEPILRALIKALSSSLPDYSLPAASHSHTRHYMPQRDPDKTTLVFDAFAAVAPEDSLLMAWPELELPPDQLQLLDDLLAAVGYLGRAESWVEARRIPAGIETGVEPNCRPEVEAAIQGGRPGTELIPMLAPLSAKDYAARRESFLADKAQRKKLSSTLPEDLLCALSVETAELRKLGWSQPPASRTVLYRRPAEALHPQRRARPAPITAAFTARYILIGKPLPRVEDGVRIAEMFRHAVMSRAKEVFGAEAIPAAISGHGLPEGNRHQHAFYLPWDENRDGFVDRLILHLPEGMSPGIRAVVENLRRLWNREGNDWQVVLESLGAPAVAGRLFEPSPEWESATPYLHPWHAKRGMEAEAQIRRECRLRGMPELLSLEAIPSVKVGHRPRQPLQFRRVREKRNLTQPDREGSFWRLRFHQPVAGPLALGFGCHFGLGLFQPSPLRH